MNSLVVQISKKIVQKYSQDKNVLGMFLFGSALTDKDFDQYSDIDFYIITRKYKKFSRFNFIYHNRHVDILFDTFQKMKTYFEEEKFSVYRNVTSMMANANIVYEKSPELSKLMDIAKKNIQLPSRVTKNEILMHQYSIDDFFTNAQRDLSASDTVAFAIDCQFLIGNLIELFLKTKKDYFRPPLAMSRHLTKLDFIFSKKLREFYAGKTMEEKKKALEKLIKYSKNKFLGSLPLRWHITK